MVPVCKAGGVRTSSEQIKWAKLPCVTPLVTDRCFLPDLAGLSYLQLRRTWPKIDTMVQMPERKCRSAGW